MKYSNIYILSLLFQKFAAMSKDQAAKILGIEPTATQSQINMAYRMLARSLHPDINKNPDATERMVQLNKAKEALSDAESRSAREPVREYEQPASEYFRNPFRDRSDDYEGMINLEKEIDNLNFIELKEIYEYFHECEWEFESPSITAEHLQDIAHRIRNLKDEYAFALIRKINNKILKDQYHIYEEDMAKPFVNGSEVKIIEGPFTNFSGVILEINDDKVIVELHIFGKRIPQEFHINQISNITKGRKRIDKELVGEDTPKKSPLNDLSIAR